MKNESLEFDVLIIGCGVGGLSAGLKCAEAKLNVAFITREEDPKISNTFYAQGGIIYCPSQSKSENFKKDTKSLVDDILRASSQTAHKPAAEKLAQESGRILEEILLLKARTEFSKNPQKGSLLFTKEAAHSAARIIYKGDYTGKAIEVSLLNYLKNKDLFPNVTFLTGHTAIDLITPNHHGKIFQQRYEEHKVVGAYVFDQKNSQVKKIMSRSVVLATGGIGATYLHHSNSLGARGDGHAMAKRAQAILGDMEMVQFHPTTYYDSSTHRRFLISEALRGEGGVLINGRGEAFMKNYHPDADLAPRDIVARSILKEMVKGKTDSVFLDISFKDSKWVKERFPTIYEHCLQKNLDITKSPIPVVPAAHYSCGGVKVNLVGQTNVNQLYAVGEVACSGLHGANRLASTSLLEGLSWGYFAAEDIVSKIQSGASKAYKASSIRDWEVAHNPCQLELVQQDLLSLRQTMWNYVGPIRSKNRLQRAFVMIQQLSDEVQKFYRDTQLHDELIGLRNSLEVGLMVVKASFRNKKSIGCFYLEDDNVG
jgi:L-aspartate oxidase